MRISRFVSKSKAKFEIKSFGKGYSEMIKDTISDQLIYSTVKITCRNASSISYGSGFFMQQNLSDGNIIQAIVTNKHVLRGYDYAEITLAGIHSDGTPDDLNHVTISISDLQRKIRSHPDENIDISLLFVNDEIKKSSVLGKPVYYRSVGTDMILPPQSLGPLTSIEDVIMIGYPSGMIDTYNNKPVVRKGITATSLKLDYEGTPDFLIDISCFPGSSGSPVFLRKVGLVQEVLENKLTLGLMPNYSLLGIIHSVLTVKANGNIAQKEIPTSLAPIVEMNIPLNLGHVTKAKKILEVFDMVSKMSTFSSSV